MKFDEKQLRRCLSQLDHMDWDLIGKVKAVIWDLQSHLQDFEDAVEVEDADRLVEAVEQIQNDGEQLLKHFRTAQGEGQFGHCSEKHRPLTGEELKQISQRMGDVLLNPNLNDE